MNSASSMGWLVLLLVLLLVGGGVFLYFRAEGVAPVLSAPEALVAGRGGTSLGVRFEDPDSGLRDVRVVLSHAGGEQVLLEESYPGNVIAGGLRVDQEVQIELDEAALADVAGDAFVRVSAHDWSLRGALGGNEARLDLPLTVDLDPPHVSVHTGLTYVSQGGSGAVAYHVDEPTARDGVRVGETFYQGFPHPAGADGERVALFAVPADGPGQPEVRVVAEDAAGNRTEARWPVVVKPRAQPDAKVRLSNEFLENVVPRFGGNGESGDLVARFDRVNTVVRAENEAKIRSLVSDATPEPLFSGRLLQLANSKVTSRFGEKRTYFLDGREVSRAVHYGYDLASYAAAPITSAGAGRVVFADDLGIYGRCVLVDHGLGLVTLYGHLSRIDVAPGQRVEAGERLGLSGDTGLAGGDHLHFAVLVGETYVDPLEWWDARWVETHVDPRLRATGG